MSCVTSSVRGFYWSKSINGTVLAVIFSVIVTTGAVAGSWFAPESGAFGPLVAEGDDSWYLAFAAKGVSLTDAEALFAEAIAAVYWPAQGEVVLLLSPEGHALETIVTALPSNGELVPRGSIRVREFAEEIARSLSQLSEDVPFLCKIPVRGRGFFSGTVARLQGPVQAQSIVISESFETDPWTRWVRTDETNGTYQFERTTCGARSGAWSLDTVRGGTLGQGLGCWSSYPGNASTAAAWGQWLNFSGAAEAWLDFYLSMETERDYDRLFVIFFDQQDNWGGWWFSGNFGSWFHTIFNLKQWTYFGDLTQLQRSVGLSFIFFSDSSVESGFGARVDDLTLRTNERPNYTCSIVATPTSGPAPLTVQFSLQTTGYGPGASYAWDFKDGSTSSLPSPQHTFANPGNYDVSVQITEASHHCAANRKVSVTAQAPNLNVVINQIESTGCPTMKAYVSVFDASGNPVTGLGTNNFELREDGQIRPIAVQQVGTSERLALSLVLDSSGSISSADLQNIKQAATALINMLGPSDLVAIFEFNSVVRLLQDYTSNKAAAIAAVSSMVSGGSTALYDAIYQAAQHSTTVTGRKSLVVMTDGEDNFSSRSEADAIAKAREVGVPVFTVGFGSANQTVLNRIATQTGGVFYPAATSAELQDLFRRIGSVLANQYVITWTARAADGGTHNVEVRVTSGAASGTATATYSQANTPCGVAFNYVYFVPTVTRGSGLYQSVWRSDVALLNAGTQAAQAELVFHQSGTSRTSRQAIPAGSQAVFGDVVGTLFASNGSGMLEVRSTTPLVVSSRLFNLNPANAPCYAGATLGQNIDAFSRQQALRAGQTAYLPQLAQVTGVFRTNILLANLGDTQAQVRLELFAGNGSKLYEYPTITLASRESRLEVEPFRTKAGQTNMTTGFARVTVLTGDAVVALASVVDSVTQDPTTVLMKP